MRRALVPVAIAALAFPAPASAAPFSYADARGDTVTKVAAHDVLGVTYEARGTGTGRAFRATELVVTLRLAAAPASDAATSYEVSAVAACGDVFLVYAPGAAYSGTAGPGWVSGRCATTVPTLAGVSGYRRVVPTEVRGDSIVWRVPLAHTTLRTGDALRGHLALAQPSDPALGQLAAGPVMNHLIGTAYDTATSDAAWRLR